RTGGVTAATLRVPLDSSYLAGMGRSGSSVNQAALTIGPPGGATEISLEPYDNVLILEQPDWQLQRAVMLTGEVRFPGRYTLKTKDERISDVIQRAGGLNAEADAGAAYFSRTRAASSYAADSIAERERTRIGLDLAQAIRRPRGTENLVLMDR